MVLRLRGGNPASRPSELGIAAGGMIKQNVRRDTHDPSEWAKGFIIPFRVQILDSSTFRQVTGHEPPACPIDAATVRPPGKSSLHLLSFTSELQIFFVVLSSNIWALQVMQNSLLRIPISFEKS